MRVLLVDPSLFTAPYDAALTRGLLAAGVAPRWWVRPLRDGERAEIPVGYAAPAFYRHTDALRWAPAPLRALAKGLSHCAGLVRLVRHVASVKPDVVHFQWTVLPALDALALLALRRHAAVVLTVHDTQAFNGEVISLLQNFAFDWPARVADRVIVHTRSGRETLAQRGVDASKLSVVPHGPLELAAACDQPGAGHARVAAPGCDAPVRFTLFGEIKPYKGADLLVEALGLLPEAVRASARVVIAGRPRMPLTSLHQRVRALGLSALIELVPRRLSEAEMAELFARTDCFVFPYRQIDASGVYYLVKARAPWIIATRVGVFAEELEDGAQGSLVPAEHPGALAAAMRRVIEQRPRAQRASQGAAWEDIGQATLALYQAARAARPGLTQPPGSPRATHVRPRRALQGPKEAAP